MAKILMIDTDLAALEVTAELELAGHNVWIASDSANALYLLKGPRQYDLMITELTLSGGSTLTLIEVARKQQPSLPIIVASGTIGPQSTEIRATLKRLGVEEILGKPIDVQLLLEAVERSLRKRS